ncbi:MAG TPA: ATP-grasp domain-containing protein [Mogibacterium sp.]|nr:ATP-grasp domain-containing protein [Mogibacterium sp.]
MEKILILGAGPFQLPLIKKAKEMGVYVVVIAPHEKYPGISVADKAYFHDAKDEEFAFEVAKKEKVNGVISDQGEIFVRAVAYAAEKAGLPGNPYKTALIYTNKYKMREKSRELGLATIDSRKARTLEETIKAFKEFDGNAIIKPVDSSASRGIFKIENENELRAHFEETMSFSMSGELIIEEFIEGPQLEVNSIAVGGKIKPLMYADLEDFSIPNVFSSKKRLYPSAADKEVVNRLLEYNQKINEGFGMIQGLSHNEYVMDGKTGEIYLIEAALRGGGNFVGSDIAPLQTGLDMEEFLVNVSLGKLQEVPEFEMNQCHCAVVSFYMPYGEIISMDGTDEVESLEYVVNTKFNLFKEGNHTDKISDKRQRCTIVLYGNSRKQILERIEEIKGKLDIKVRTDEGEIRGPIWD